MEDDKPRRWQRLKKVSFKKKDVARRMRKVETATIRHAHKFIIKRWSNVREVRRRIITWVMAVGLLIGAAGLQLMWYQQNYKTTAASTGGTYAEAVLGPVDTLNPLFSTSSAEEAARHLLFSQLFAYDTSGNLNNDAATGMTVSPDGLTYTVAIRSDIKWHDGRQLTARDVAFTVDLLKNPAVGSTIPADWRDIAVKIVDDTTLTFTLPVVIASFSHALTFPIVPHHILSKIEPNAIRENGFGSTPIGSGPFKFRFVQDIDVSAGRKVVHLERAANYYRGAPKLELFQIHVYGTQEEIVRALSSGEVNAAAGLSSSDARMVDSDRYNVYVKPIKSGVYALLNTTRETLKDVVVRQALQRGTDTTALRAQLPRDTPALELPFIDGQLSGDVPKVPDYNPTEAKALLESAGWKLDGTKRKKDGVELRLAVVTIKDSDYERVLETLVGQWRELGIVVDTSVVDPSDAAQRVNQDILQQRNYDVLLYQLTIGVDPDVYAYWHSTQATSRGFNFSNYSNIISDDALSSARSRLEPSLRNAKYLTFAKQWVGDVPAIALYQSTTHYVHSKNVHSFATSNDFVSPIDRYDDVLYWAVGTRPVYKTP